MALVDFADIVSGNLIGCATDSFAFLGIALVTNRVAVAAMYSFLSFSTLHANKTLQMCNLLLSLSNLHKQIGTNSCILIQRTYILVAYK